MALAASPQGAPIDIARRSTVERRVRAHIVVKVEPGADHALCIASIGQFVQVHRLVLQRPPQPLDEDVVEIAAAAVHGAACASRAYPVGERVAGKLGTLVRVEYLRGAGMQRRLERVDAENAVHRVRQPPRQGKRSVLGGSALIVLHFSVIELEDCFESLLTGGDKKTAVGVW